MTQTPNQHRGASQHNIYYAALDIHNATSNGGYNAAANWDVDTTAKWHHGPTPNWLHDAAQVCSDNASSNRLTLTKTASQPLTPIPSRHCIRVPNNLTYS